MNKYRISGIPVVDDGHCLIGIITNRDLRFEPDEDPARCGDHDERQSGHGSLGTTLQQAEHILQKHKIEKLPVVDKHGVLNGLITFKDIRRA